MKDYTEKILLVLLSICITISLVTFAFAEEYLIIHPIENADGTPLEDLAGITVKCGEDPWLSIGMVTVWTGPKDCTFRAYDTGGNLSEPWSTKVGIKPYPPIVIIYGAE